MADRRIVTISYTEITAPGGVPKFNRDLHSAFPDRPRAHFCWQDYPWYIEVDEQGETEWGRARRLNEYLTKSRLITPSDVVIADGFWASGLEYHPLAISHSHGIWSHLTSEEAEAGLPPDMPAHHAAQVVFRQRWCRLGKTLTAVSDFIAEQMRQQWGFKVRRVINNGVDLEIFRPTKRFPRERSIVVHGVNDRGNLNKGWDHIEAVRDRLATAASVRAEVLSLDEMVERYGGPKEWALAQADVVVHPSGYEGNSMFVAETLACGVPLVAYDVGYLWSRADRVGMVIDRVRRSPLYTAQSVAMLLENMPLKSHLAVQNRVSAEKDLSIVKFQNSWRELIDDLEAK